MNEVLRHRIPAVAAPSKCMVKADDVLKPFSTDGNNALVLVVDDDADSRLMLRTYLEMWGGRVVEATDGQGALDAVEKHAPDIIVLDLTLPGMGGLDTLRSLRKREAWNALPVVVLSGHAEPKWRTQALAAGGDEYLVKPISLDELGNVLKRRLDGNEPES